MPNGPSNSVPMHPDRLPGWASSTDVPVSIRQGSNFAPEPTKWLSKPELLTAAYANAGRIDEANKVLSTHIESIAPEMMQLPHNWLDYFVERCPYVREEDIDHYVSGLEAAVR